VDSSGNGRDGDRRHRAARRPALPGRQRNEDTGDVGLKVVNTRSHAIRTQVDLGSKRHRHRHRHGPHGALTDVNSFDQPNQVAPVTTAVSGLGNRFVYDFAPNSLTFIRRHP
jgi:alpha-L-arabinofuranosidase